MKLLIFKYFKDLITPPTLQEIIEQRMREEIKLIMNADYVILTHKFQKHMANATLAALGDWNSLQRKLELKEKMELKEKEGQ